MNYNFINPDLISQNPMLKLCKQLNDLTDGMCQTGVGPFGFGTSNNHKAAIGLIIASEPGMVKNNHILPKDIEGYNIRVECYSEAKNRCIKPEEIESIARESTDANTLKIYSAWQVLSDSSQYINTADCKEAYKTLGDLEFGEEISLYCPVDVCHLPGMTYDEFYNLEDGYEESFLQDYRIQDTAFLKNDAAAEFGNHPDIQKTMAHYKDDFPDILPNIIAAYFDFVEKNGRLWLNTLFALKECVDTERMREFAAESINGYAIQGGSFQKKEGLYLISIEPHRIYNQTNCTAPVYQENALLTEDEFKAFANYIQHQDETGTDSNQEESNGLALS